MCLPVFRKSARGKRVNPYLSANFTLDRRRPRVLGMSRHRGLDNVSDVRRPTAASRAGTLPAGLAARPRPIP
jgi:hypothetical protein